MWLSDNQSYKSTIDALVKAATKEVRITSEVANINLNLDTLKEIQKQVGSDVSISANKVSGSTLSAETKKVVGNRPVYDFSITGSNNKKVTNFGKGSISIAIPYTLGANENAENLIVYYIDATGKTTEMTNSVYDSATKTLGFVTNHFSKFAVGYKNTNVKFTDINKHWAKDSIEFVVARGLLNGVNGKFNPNAKISQKDLIDALNKLSGKDMTNTIENYDGNLSIFRERLAVVMANYAKAIGFELPKVHAEITFADNAKISDYAKTAVKQMQMAGIISSKNSNKFDPKGTATRAEVSAMLKRFIELTVSTDSAEGFTINDSGKWLYYKDGKALTGKQTIDKVTYTFNKYGETSIAPSSSFDTYIVQKGESWWNIAWKKKVNMFTLAKVNGKTIFSTIYIGDELVIPTTK